MVKKPKRTISPSGKRINRSKFEKIENETLSKVSSTLSKIENAIAVYESSGNKQENLKERINRLRIFHQKLSNWEREMLVARTRNDVGKRFDMVEKFVDICYAY